MSRLSNQVYCTTFLKNEARNSFAFTRVIALELLLVYALNLLNLVSVG